MNISFSPKERNDACFKHSNFFKVIDPFPFFSTIRRQGKKVEKKILLAGKEKITVHIVEISERTNPSKIKQ